jgi:hypothetical protein
MSRRQRWSAACPPSRSTSAASPSPPAPGGTLLVVWPEWDADFASQIFLDDAWSEYRAIDTTHRRRQSSSFAAGE